MAGTVLHSRRTALAAEDFGHGERQQPLRGFLKGRIEDLVHFDAQQACGDQGGRPTTA